MPFAVLAAVAVCRLATLPTLSGGKPNPESSGPLECFPDDLPMGAGRAGGASIDGPTAFDSASLADWHRRMKEMRNKCQTALNFTGGAFEVPELLWTQTAYISPQMHPYDRFFFDPALGNGTGGAGYTVDKWLGDLNARYGGIDKALIWPTYTNIGIDDRNTFDLIRSMPGGVEGIKVVVQQLHDRGVKVLWPYHPWDHSTRGQEKNNLTDYMNMAILQRDTGADGFNGDTMAHIPKGFYDAAVNIYKPIAMEPEAGLSVAWDLNYMTLGWAEGWNSDEAGAYKNVIDVDKAKWITNGKSMVNFCNRWEDDNGKSSVRNHNITHELQYVLFNGIGYETWENVWGTWNGLTDRSSESIRRVATLLRYFGSRRFLQSKAWVPHSVEFLQMKNSVFGSAFPQTDTQEVVYLLVNRLATSSSGPQIAPAVYWTNKSLNWFDCYNGTPLKLDSSGKLSFTIEAEGFGCVVGTKNTTSSREIIPAPSSQLRTEAPVQPADLAALLSTMAAYAATPLSAYDDTWQYLNQTLVDANATTAIRPLSNASANEVYVSGASYTFVASGVELEGKLGSGVDVQFPGESHPGKYHNFGIQIGAMYVDKHPVTNADYAAYLAASHYFPADSANWLRDNFANGSPTPGWEQKPVTYVSLEDARHYCAFHSKRLPHAYEWQYFAQGHDQRLYPWGNIDNANFTPGISNNWTNPGPEPVGKYPEGASPFGVEDLVRNVWQYTSEFQDIHTRSVILRGGASYGPSRENECRWINYDNDAPRDAPPTCFESTDNTPVPGSFDPKTGFPLKHPMGGSRWYFPPAFELNTYNKYFLMSGSYERAGTVGFRCVADAEDDCGTGGHLCPKQSSPPATDSVDDALADWVLFGVPESTHSLGNVSKHSSSSSGGGDAMINHVFSLGSLPPQTIVRVSSIHFVSLNSRILLGSSLRSSAR